MNYKELIFTITSQEEFHRDLLINALSEVGFDTFEETDSGFKAYIPSAKYNQEQLDEVLLAFHPMFPFSYEINVIPQKNWNEVWESNFDPLQIGDTCYVRASFHDRRPEFPYQIVIDPKMSFGTGHHQTTAMMMEFMLNEEFKDKKVLDMGCGTGILAILASQLGATEILAIDYDPICYASTIENANLNGVSNITALCGSKEAIGEGKFNFILANINRNILLDQVAYYAKALNEDGVLLISGFYETPDLHIIKDAASAFGLKYIEHKNQQNWVAAKFVFNE